jgi:hypothetical protein
MRLGFFSCSTFVLATFALGCDEPIPPTPQGAFLVNFFDTGAMCPHKSHQSMMGVLNQTDRTTVAVDGVKTAEVSCSVVGGTLGPFAVEASLTFDGTESLTVSVKNIDSKATDIAPAQGSVGYSSSVTGGNFFGSNQPCDFYIEAAGPSGIGEGVKPGSAWLSFKCPSIVESNNTCSLNESYVLMENCTQ